MADIKNVLELLCKHLNLSIKVAIKPEYFRLSKYNKITEQSNSVLWATLHALSFYAAKEKRTDIYFEEYDELSATKLYFAFLQYPVIEFYGLSESCTNSRVLLLAFSWLLATQSVLSVVVRVQLLSSILGRECSHPDVSLTEVSAVGTTCSVNTQIKNILHHNSKVNFNLKHISELLQEKAKLANKAHGVSLNIDRLAHMNIMEIVLIKRLLAIHTDSNSTEQQKSELYTIGAILDVHVKWMEKEHIFYDWMITVIKECDKSPDVNTSKINWTGVANFISLLEYIIKRKLYSICSEKTKDSMEYFKLQCTSRLLRTSDIKCEANKLSMDTNARLSQVKESLRINKEELALQLKNILMTVPQCIKV
ncbi:hypothetical protein KPH14_008831 [Odynerus spinipes]|uniref:Tubulin epsilon and delta complex protein 1 domain-containing protein n=1 Tax=Odynerus spinipes TaxID=1348599 RepID=A0AAD9VIN6_9HYME|nr:hypothetical protein KPH14_008831 [Odynerus spinipes]